MTTKHKIEKKDDLVCQNPDCGTEMDPDDENNEYCDFCQRVFCPDCGAEPEVFYICESDHAACIDCIERKASQGDGILRCYLCNTLVDG